jgi:predicted nucleic acid-binding protein
VVDLSALLDTSVLIGARAPDPDVVQGGWALSAISLGELSAGVLIATDPAVRAARLRRATSVAAEAPVLAIDRAVAARYGELRAASGRKPTNDLWIAATALAHDLTLITRDEGQAALPLVRSVLVD